MNVQSKIARMTTEQRVHAQRVEQLGLASAALLGLVHVRGPICHEHQAVVMGHLNDLFGFTPAESDRASDMLFEATLNHSIADEDRPRIEKCALALSNIAVGYAGDATPIWAAGFELFEIDSLWEASQPEERAPRYDPVFADGSASLRYWGRV